MSFYDMTVSFVGVLPVEFTFVYGLVMIFFIIMVLFSVYAPFFLTIMLMKGRR